MFEGMMSIEVVIINGRCSLILHTSPLADSFSQSRYYFVIDDKIN